MIGELRRLKTLRQDLLDGINDVENSKAAGKLTEKQADKQLTEQFGPGYYETLKEVQTLIDQEEIKLRTTAAITVLALLIIPAVLFAGPQLTGLLTVFQETSTTVDINQVFSENTIFATGITDNITSLRANGIYVGTGSFSIIHIAGDGSETTVFSGQATAIPENFTVLEQNGRTSNLTPVQQITFNGCQETCGLNASGPHQLRIEMTEGTLNLTSITYTQTELVEIPNQDAVVEEEIIQVPQRNLPTQRPERPPRPEPPEIERPTQPELPAQRPERDTRPGSSRFAPPREQELPALRAEFANSRQERLAAVQERISSIRNVQGNEELQVEDIQRLPSERSTQFSEGQSFGKIKTQIDLDSRVGYGIARRQARNGVESLGVATQEEKNTYGRLPERQRPGWILQKRAVTRLTSARNNEAVPLILKLREQQNTELTGKQYGDLLFTELTLDEVNEIPGLDSPFEFIALDQKISIQITNVEQTIQSQSHKIASSTGGNKDICVIDSGIDSSSIPGQNVVAEIDFLEEDGQAQDTNGHGTLMASAITQIAPQSRLYIAKIIENDGTGRESDVIRAIDWCMTQNVDIISMSFGGGYYASWCDDDSLMAQKANEAAARGIFVSAATGNGGQNIMNSPACGSLVTSVGNSQVDEEGESVSPSSDHTAVTDVFAPGTNVTVTGRGDVSASVSGSSISAAILSGAAALIAEETGLEAQDLQDRIRSTGEVISSNRGDFPSVRVLNAVNNIENGLNLTQNGYQSENEGDGEGVRQSLCPGEGEVCNIGDCVDTCQGGTELCNLQCDAPLGGNCADPFGAADDCAGTCGDYCTGGFSPVCTNAPSGTVGPSGTTGAYTCSGQTIQRSACSGSGGTTQTITTCSGNCDSVCVSGTGTCVDSAAGADPGNICSGAATCSGQDPIDNNNCGTGTACGYDAPGSCSGTCANACVSGSCTTPGAGTDPASFCPNSQCYTGTCDGSGSCGIQSGTDSYNYCTASGYTCSGQTITQSNNGLCDGGGATSCGSSTGATCSGNCNSVCVNGNSACVDSSPGTDPGNICSGGYTCSGQTIINNNVCGSGTACGQSGTTCSGNCDSLCVSGSSTCYNTAPGADPYGICPNSQCYTGTCGSGTACGIQSDGSDTWNYCTASGWTCSGETPTQSNDGACSGSGNNCGSASGSSCANTCASDCINGFSTCQPATAGTDPSSECGGFQCEGDNCNGAGSCQVLTSGEGACGACLGCANDGNVDCDVTFGFRVDDTQGSNQCTGSSTCDGGGNCDLDYGTVCSSDGQCVNNICGINEFEGSLENRRCIPSNSYCVTDASAPYYFQGTSGSNTVSGNTCYGSTSGGSAWIADSGRYEITDGSNTLSLIDQYGSMVVRGTRSFSQTSFDSGYQVNNAAGTPQVSIETTSGDLKLRGASITERTTPSGTGVQIRNTGATTVAILTSSGTISLAGDFAYNVGSALP